MLISCALSFGCESFVEYSRMRRILPCSLGLSYELDWILEEALASVSLVEVSSPLFDCPQVFFRREVYSSIPRLYIVRLLKLTEAEDTDTFDRVESWVGLIIDYPAFCSFYMRADCMLFR